MSEKIMKPNCSWLGLNQKVGIWPIHENNVHTCMQKWTKIGRLKDEHIRQMCSEPPHDKTNKKTVNPAKTQISLVIRSVWSESSLNG